MNKKLLTLFLFSFSLLLSLLPVHVLEIRFNDFTLLIPLTSSLILSIEYTHSVSLTKVVDVYEINESGIYAIETRWQDFIAGQPLNGSLEGSFFVKKLKVFLGKSWEYWFISSNNFTLRVNGVRLVQPPQDGFLEFRVKVVPALKTITGW